MSRCGTYTLLVKYANPTSKTQLIMVARKTHYHPYSIVWTKFQDSCPVLVNGASFGDILFASCISASSLAYTYANSEYNITFGRCANRTLICIKIYKHELTINFVRINQDEFRFENHVPTKLLIFVNKIQESSLSEIIEHHLCNLIKLIVKIYQI